LFGWIPLIGPWAGLGEPSKVTFVALAVAYVMVLAAHEAVRSISPRLAEVARALGLREPRQRVFQPLQGWSSAPTWWERCCRRRVSMAQEYLRSQSQVVTSAAPHDLEAITLIARITGLPTT
jgi:hypothetical protein